jgi:hypothetical protein
MSGKEESFNSAMGAFIEKIVAAVGCATIQNGHCMSSGLKLLARRRH